VGLLAGLRERRTLGEVSIDLEMSRARVLVLEEMAAAMLGCVKSLVLDIDEIGAQALQDDLGRALGRLRAGDDVLTLADQTEHCRSEALSFADRERLYLAHRDSELRRIIEVLTEGMVAMSNGAATYHRKLLDTGARVEAATRLSDLVRMRSAITNEVRVLRNSVTERQVEESKANASLRSEIDCLRVKVEHARSEARVDALTQAANRASFDDELGRRCELASSGVEGFALLLADVDYFKAINDTHGHPVGDRVLHALVVFLRDRVRREDLIARWGGEEFAVILPGASLRSAHQKAKTMVRELSEREWIIDQAKRLRFTMSIGVTAWRPGDEPNEMVGRADRALYNAKNKGRNRALRLA